MQRTRVRRPRGGVALIVGLGFAAATTGVVWLTAHAGRGDVGTALAELQRFDPLAAAAAVAIVVAALVNRGIQTRAAYRAAGVHIGAQSAVAVTVASYGANKVTKSGGLAGLAIHLADSRRRGIASAGTVAAYAAVSVSGGVSMALLILLTLLTMVDLAIAVLASMAAGCLIWWVRRLRGIASGVGPGPTGTRCTRLLRRMPGEIDAVELRLAIAHLRAHPRHLAAVALHGFAAKAFGVATLHVALLGVGVELAPATTLRIATLALVAAALGPLPAGLGTAEASITAVMLATGIDPVAAVSATAVFRLFDVWLPVGLAASVAPFVIRRGVRSQAAADGGSEPVASAHGDLPPSSRPPGRAVPGAVLQVGRLAEGL